MNLKEYIEKNKQEETKRTRRGKTHGLDQSMSSNYGAKLKY